MQCSQENPCVGASFFIKLLYQKKTPTQCFPVNIAEFLRTPFFTKHLRWLLLNIRKPFVFWCIQVIWEREQSLKCEWLSLELKTWFHKAQQWLPTKQKLLLVLLHLENFRRDLLVLPSFWCHNERSVGRQVHATIRSNTKNSTARKVSKCGVFSGPHFPAFGLNTERYSISLRIQSECGKIRTRKNSVFELFSSSAFLINSSYSVFLSASYLLHHLAYLTYFRPMLHVWINQVAGFY